MKKITTEEFITKANEIHNNKYDYTELEYVNARTPVTIICKTHGTFTQKAASHLNGNGCTYCGNAKNNADDFVTKATQKHNNKYDYSLVKYVDSKTKVTIICETHGEFTQTPAAHLNQLHGCPKCGTDRTANSRKYNTDDFIFKAASVHNDKYDYSLTNYISSKEPVDIICKSHGKFTQNANHHLNGQGCPICSREISNTGGWSDTSWESLGNNSKTFTEYKVYIIRCWDNFTKEEFYKIGKTFNDVKVRFKSKYAMPYSWEVVKLFTGESHEISNIERKLHKENKEFKYMPKKDFRGMYECFSKLNIELV